MNSPPYEVVCMNAVKILFHPSDRKESIGLEMLDTVMYCLLVDVNKTKVIIY